MCKRQQIINRLIDLISEVEEYNKTGSYILPKTTSKKFRPYGKFMYGSNRVIVVKGDSKLDKNYLGPTLGVGLEMRFGRSASHGINIDLNFPINSQEFKDDLQFLKDSPMYEVSDPLPIAISIGYHFEI